MNLGGMAVFLVGVGLWAPYSSLGHSYRWNSTSTNRAIPTVTAEAGDQGGRFFGQVPDAAQTRHYYIAAEWQLWDYAPVNKDPIWCCSYDATARGEHSVAKAPLRSIYRRHLHHPGFKGSAAGNCGSGAAWSGGRISRGDVPESK